MEQPKFMKILIDATGITREKAGVGVYAKNLLSHLTAFPSDMEIFILAQDDDPEMDFSGRSGVTMIHVPARWFRILPLRLLLEQFYLPALLHRRSIDVVHSLHYAFPLVTFGSRRVVTFHDMTFFTMPEVHERAKVVYFRFFMWAMGRLADHSIFISRSALEDYRERLGKERGASSVVPHGKGEMFRPEPPFDEIALRERYALRGPFALYLGTIEPRKNLPRLVEAFGSIALKYPALQLVLAGKKGWMFEELEQTIRRLRLTNRVHFTGFVAEEDKPALLASCALFIYPSLYEGFGLPALEAIACGAPTITSNTSSLPEVVGDAALLVDPTSVESLGQAMEAVLSNPALREELKRKGPVQAKLFTWEKTAAATVDIYRSLFQLRTARWK
jgi:glycosyltransferase involved in cell wall biosynthesis